MQNLAYWWKSDSARLELQALCSIDQCSIDQCSNMIIVIYGLVISSNPYSRSIIQDTLGIVPMHELFTPEMRMPHFLLVLKVSVISRFH